MALRGLKRAQNRRETGGRGVPRVVQSQEAYQQGGQKPSKREAGRGSWGVPESVPELGRTRGKWDTFRRELVRQNRAQKRIGARNRGSAGRVRDSLLTA